MLKIKSNCFPRVALFDLTVICVVTVSFNLPVTVTVLVIDKWLCKSIELAERGR